jgi:SAC3/GANP family
MCSKKECVDRERFGEVSVFECHDGDSRGLQQNQRRIDPCRAVSKYRRSAAGSSVEDRYPVRTVDQLAATVEHVLEILAEQRAPPTTDSDSNGQRETMLATVSFVEDRLRAVQVDLVKLQHPSSSRRLQLRMARAHTVILYIMADCTAYEATFGAKLLQTALSSYFLASPPATQFGDDTDGTDEVLSYILLFALTQDLLEAANAGKGLLDAPLSSVSTSLAAHRHRFHARLRPRHDDPSLSESSPTTLQWTMLLLSHLIAGHWHMALRHVSSNQAESPTGNLENHGPTGHLRDAFVTLSRCLLAPLLRHMRLEALKCYNACFGKGEAVPASFVARLVQMPPSAQSEDFLCSNEKSTWDHYPDEPASLSVPSGRQRGGDAAHAAYRFAQEVGLQVGADGTLLFKVASSPPLRMRPNRSVRNEEDFLVLRGLERGDDEVKIELRTDSDGIRLPPPSWMRRHTA